MDYVHKIIKTLQPSFLQFHGDETPNFCNQFDYPYIKAIRVSPDLNIERKQLNILTRKGVFYLIRGIQKNMEVQVELLIGMCCLMNLKHQRFFAGGLTSTNVGQAIKIARPDVVDVSGGVESVKGILRMRD